MSDLRSVFTSRDFIINSNIVKCISKIDITLKDGIEAMLMDEIPEVLGVIRVE